jgi:hypothetical protein
MQTFQVLALLQFDEIFSGAPVRLVMIDGLQYLSVRDIIQQICGKDDHCADQIWHLISVEICPELRISCLNYKFPDQKQSEQSVITFPGALDLMRILP